MFWKSVRKYYCQQQGISGLEYVSAEEIKTLYSQSFCENALVPAESLLKYMTKKNEKNLFSQFSIEDIVRMAYAHSIRKVKDFSGKDFLQADRAICPPELLELIRKTANFKDNLIAEDYKTIPLYNTALFEICRRNDATLLQIYLNDFSGYCHKGIYDAVCDYYIYMYLPNWSELKKYNSKNSSKGGFPGVYSQRSKKAVSQEIQERQLEVLIRQAKQCGAPYPDVLKILFRYNAPSYRKYFPINEQPVQLGMEFSARNTFNTRYAGRLLFYYNNKNLTPDEECVDPYELNKLLACSGYALPINCICGCYECGGIDAVSESWVIGNTARLYIPIKGKVYYFSVDDRIKLRRELLLMLKHIVKTLQCHEKLQQTINTLPEYNNNYEKSAFLPQDKSFLELQDLCKSISDDLSI